MYTGNWIYLALVLFSFHGLALMFDKMNVKRWKAYVPIYNFWIYCKLLGKPGWWGLLMLVPGVNLMMYGVLGFLTARAFKRNKTSDTIMAIVLPYVFFYTVGTSKENSFHGLAAYSPEPNAFVKNWADPIIFAVIAASVIPVSYTHLTLPTKA